MPDSREGSSQSRFTESEPPVQPVEPDAPTQQFDTKNLQASEAASSGEVTDALSDSAQEKDEDQTAQEEDTRPLSANRTPHPSTNSTIPNQPLDSLFAPIRNTNQHEEDFESGEHLDVVRDTEQTGHDRTAASAEEAAAKQDSNRRVYPHLEQNDHESV